MRGLTRELARMDSANGEVVEKGGRGSGMGNWSMFGSFRAMKLRSKSSGFVMLLRKWTFLGERAKASVPISGVRPNPNS